jgi:hypothetical protein
MARTVGATESGALGSVFAIIQQHGASPAMLLRAEFAR